MSRLKYIFNLLFKFFIAIIFFLILLIIILKTSVLDSKYIINKLEKNNYYEKLDNEIIISMRNYTIQSGLTDEVIENIYTKDKLISDLNSYVKSVLSKNDFNIDTTSLYNNLEEQISIYSKEHNIVIESEKELKDLEDKIIEEYTNNITINKVLGSIFNKINTIVKLINYGVIVLSILLIVMLILKKVLFKEFNFNITFITAGLLLLFLVLYCKIMVSMDNFLFINEIFSELIKDIYFSFINTLLRYGIIIFVIGIIFSLLKRKKDL